MRRYPLPLFLAMTVAVPASAQPALPCLTDAEGRAAAALALSPVISGVAQRCGGAFPAVSARLATRGAGFAARFTDDGDAAVDVIGSKLLSDIAPNLALGPSEAMRPVIRGMLSDALASRFLEDVDASVCRAAEAALPALEPLTDAQVIDLAAAALKGGVILSEDRSPIRFCEAS